MRSTKCTIFTYLLAFPSVIRARGHFLHSHAVSVFNALYCIVLYCITYLLELLTWCGQASERGWLRARHGKNTRAHAVLKEQTRLLWFVVQIHTQQMEVMEIGRNGRRCSLNCRRAFVTAAKEASSRLYGSTAPASKKKVLAVLTSHCFTTPNNRCSPCVLFRSAVKPWSCDC